MHGQYLNLINKGDYSMVEKKKERFKGRGFMKSCIGVERLRVHGSGQRKVVIKQFLRSGAEEGKGNLFYVANLRI
jgi:ATP:corrinoid adenosyltransferase